MAAVDPPAAGPVTSWGNRSLRAQPSPQDTPSSPTSHESTHAYVRKKFVEKCHELHNLPKTSSLSSSKFILHQTKKVVRTVIAALLLALPILTITLGSYTDDQRRFKLPDRWLRSLFALVPFFMLAAATAAFRLPLPYTAPLTAVALLASGVLFFQCTVYAGNDEDEVNLPAFCAGNDSVPVTWSTPDNFFPVVTGKAVLDSTDRVMWTIVDYVYTLSSATVFVEVMNLWGVFAGLANHLEAQQLAPLVQLIVVGYGLSFLLSSVMPGGVGFLISGGILVAMVNDTSGGRPNERVQEASERDVQGSAVRHRNAWAAGMLYMASQVAPMALAGLPSTVAVDILRELPLPYTVDRQLSLDDAEKEMAQLYTLGAALMTLLSPFIMVGIAIPRGVVLFKRSGEKLLECGVWLGRALLTNAILLFTGALLAAVPVLMSNLAGPRAVNAVTGLALMLWGVVVHSTNLIKLTLRTDPDVAVGAAAVPRTPTRPGTTAAPPQPPPAGAPKTRTAKEAPGAGGGTAPPGAGATGGDGKAQKHSLTCGSRLFSDWSQSLWRMLPLLVASLWVAFLPWMADQVKLEDDDDLTKKEDLAPGVWRVLNGNAGLLYLQWSYIVHPGFVYLCMGLLTPFLVPPALPTRWRHVTGTPINDAPASYALPTHGGFQQDCRMHTYSLIQSSASILTTGKWRPIRAVLHAVKAPIQRSGWTVLVIGSLAAGDRLAFRFGMSDALASTIADALGDSLPLCIPLFGFLCSLFSGSVVISSFLLLRPVALAALQTDLVTATSNSLFEVGAMFMLGAAVGLPMSQPRSVLLGTIMGVRDTPRQLFFAVMSRACVTLGVVTAISYGMLQANIVDWTVDRGIES